MSSTQHHLQGLNRGEGLVCEPYEAPLWRASYVAREVILICPEGMQSQELEVYFDALVRYMVCYSDTYCQRSC